MLFIKIYGCVEMAYEGLYIRNKVGAKMRELYGGNNVTIVSIPSVACTAEEKSESFQYVEVFYPKGFDINPAIKALKELNIGIYVIKILFEELITADEMK